MIQEQLKSLMYVDRSLRGDPKKYKFIDELNFKHCLRLKIKTTSKFFVGIKYKKKVVLKPGWISGDFDFCEPEFYKLVTTVTCDDDSKKIL